MNTIKLCLITGWCSHDQDFDPFGIYPKFGLDWQSFVSNWLLYPLNGTWFVELIRQQCIVFGGILWNRKRCQILRILWNCKKRQKKEFFEIVKSRHRQPPFLRKCLRAFVRLCVYEACVIVKIDMLYSVRLCVRTVCHCKAWHALQRACASIKRLLL